MRAKEPSVVGIVPPSDLRIEFYPFIRHFSVLCHLDYQFDCQLGHVLSLDDPVDD